MSQFKKTALTRLFYAQTLCVVIASSVQGQSVLVKDITTETSEIDSSPVEGVNLNDILYYVARDPEYGKELWKTDGTTVGTELVKDIWPGRRDSYPANLTVVGDIIFLSPMTVNLEENSGKPTAQKKGRKLCWITHLVVVAARL